MSLSINDSLKDLFLVKQLECVQVFHMNWHAIVAKFLTYLQQHSVMNQSDRSVSLAQQKHNLACAPVDK